MQRKTLVAASVAVLGLYLLLALVGWTRYVIMHPVDKAKLAGLVVADPPAGFTKKPASSNVVSPSSDPFATYKTIAKRSPGQTAAYSVSWTNPKASNDSATILVSYLPSAADAQQVQAQAKTQFLGAQAFKSENYQYVQSLPVPGVPGGGAAVFKAAGTATTPPVSAVVFATGRVQVLELIGQAGTPAGTGATATALARSEYEHLTKVLPSFLLHRTSIPAVATAVYWGVAAGIVVLAVVIPMAVRRTRRRRVEARMRSARRQQQVRGSKIARRQARRR